MSGGGVVLDAETVDAVPHGARWCATGVCWWTPSHLPAPGDRLTHIGGRPVAELVAEADDAEDDARELRHMADMLDGHFYPEAIEQLRDAADRIDKRRAKAIDARLVAAAHAQWADTEERGR